MKCAEIGFGTYKCAYNVALPYLEKDPFSPNEPPRIKTVSVDKCLLPEILSLWERGIETTGCCCGHGRPDMAFIGVKDEFIPKMKELGYTVHFNPCRPDDENSFSPKTVLKYGEVDKGFNLWDEEGSENHA